MNVKTLVLLHDAEKYKDVIGILQKQGFLTNDELNIFLMCAVKYGLKYDYINFVGDCVETEYFPNINKFKSYIFTKAIDGKLIPETSTFEGYTPTNEYIINADIGVGAGIQTIDNSIIKLGVLAKNGSSYFIEQKNKLLADTNDVEKMSTIFSHCLLYARNVNDFDIGIEALNFFKDNIKFKTKKVDGLIAFFISNFIREDLEKLQANRVLFKSLLGLDDNSLDALFAGYLNQTMFKDDTVFPEKISVLESFRIVRGS